MANTGHSWGSWAFVQESASDWEDEVVTDTNTDTSDETTIGIKSACEIGLELTLGAGSVTGDVTIHVLGTIDGTIFEDITNSGAWAFNVTPIASTTVAKRFPIEPSQYGSFKIAVENQSGLSLTASVTVRTADIPVASA